MNDVKVKQPHYRPGQTLRVPGGWDTQMYSQSAHEGGKVVSPTHRPPYPPPPPQEIFLVLISFRGRDSVVGIATRYGLRSGDRIPVGARFFAYVQTVPGAHPASYTMGTGSFPGVRRPGSGADHPPPTSAEVKERVELYLYSPFGPFC
jgi:hypothetical protein